MSTSIKLNKDQSIKKVDEKKYPGILGCLLYLTASTPCYYTEC